jgi:hypothetical protein
VRDLAVSGRARLLETMVARQRLIRRRNPLPREMRGNRVGVYGQLQTPVIAHGFENEPFPAVAAYENWNPWTVELTREFLLSPRAPRFIVYTFSGFSSETIATLTEHYQMIRKRSPIILRRRERPLEVRFHEVLRKRTGWHQRVPVPPAFRTVGQPVFRVRLHYERTLLNRMVAFAYQPVPVFLVAYAGDAAVARIRVDEALAAEGTVLAARGHVNWDSASKSLHAVRHLLFTDIPSATVMPITSFAVEVLPPVLPDWGPVPAGDPWTFPFLSASWYFEPEVEVVLDRIEVTEPRAARPPPSHPVVPAG